MLTALAGLTRPASGSVRLVTSGGAGRSLYGAIGLVPQDDILHPDLPLERTLRHAAGLRIAGGRQQIRAAVDHVIQELDLAERTGVPVGQLSGGQRKRASIAVELLAPYGFYWSVLATFGVVLAMAAYSALRRRAR